MAIYQRNSQISNVYYYNSPVSQVRYRDDKIWGDGEIEEEKPDICTIDNISVYYFTSGHFNGDSLFPDASNYATVTGRVRIEKNGELIVNYTTIQLDVKTYSPYVTIANNDITFNISHYGTTDMSSKDNPFTINVNTSYSGYNGPTAQIAITPNLIASTTSHSRTNSATTVTNFLPYNQVAFTITNKNNETTRTTYTSGKYTDSTASVDGYLFQMDMIEGTSTFLASIEANGTYTINVGNQNTDSYPKVFVYRLSHLDGTTGYDDWIYIMQKSKSNTSGLQLYWGDINITNEDTIETSTYFYLANNGHTASTTYTYECEDKSIEITHKGGIFFFENVTSSSDCKAYIRDNNGNEVTFYIKGT